MSADHGYNWGRLDEPFAPDQIHWRVGQTKEPFEHGGAPRASLLAYLTSRDVQDRLDEVFGKPNWSDSYTQGPDGGVKCVITVRCGLEWVGKEDGAENTNIEAIKGGYSGALKRAAVKWGIGRYLYALGGGLISGRAGYQEGAQNYKCKKDSKWYHFLPPSLPAWALPKGWHHPSWERSAPRFCAALRDVSGLSYDQIADYLESNKLDSFNDGRRPSAMDLSEQQRLLSRLGHKEVQQRVTDWWEKGRAATSPTEEEDDNG
jgi:hypothetical protein